MILRIATLLIAALVVYPLAVSVQVFIDFWWGDAEFLGLLLQGSKKRLLIQLLGDWLAASPFSMLAMLAVLCLYIFIKAVTGNRIVPWLVLLLSVLCVAVGINSLMATLMYSAACVLFAVWVLIVRWRKL